MPTANNPPLRTVVLRHDLPDGTSHHDWLIERPGTPGLLTFRLAGRPDDPGASELRATRLPDHRPVYLDYEGEIAGGRGRVTRVAAGTARIVAETPDRVEIVAGFGGAPRRWVGTPSGAHVRFTAA